MWDGGKVKNIFARNCSFLKWGSIGVACNHQGVHANLKKIKIKKKMYWLLIALNVLLSTVKKCF